MDWYGWPLERILILFVSLSYLAIGVQVTLFHYRQNFHHKSMWTPVITAPVIFVVGAALTVANLGWLRALFVIVLLVGVVNGVVGVFLHARGVQVRVGGWAPRNFMIGPPVVLPFLFAAIGALGLIAVTWR